MSPVFATRRRAEEFDQLVASPVEVTDPRYADVLALVAQLRALEPPAPRPEFSASLRERLLDAADTLLLPAPEAAADRDVARLTLPPRRTRRDRRVAAVVGAAAILGASTSIAVAAQSALPGEMLYPVKRLLENAQTTASLGEGSKGSSLLSSASQRLVEVTELSRTSDLDEAGTIADTLTTFSDQSLEASDLLLDDYTENGDRATIEDLNAFTATSIAALAQLEAVLPPDARDELQQAAQVLAQIDAAASGACPVCKGGIDQIPPALLAAAGLGDTTGSLPPLLGSDDPSSAPRAGGANGGTADGGTGKNGGKTGGGRQGQQDGDGTLGTPQVPGTGGGTDTSPDPIGDLLGALTGEGGGTTTNGGTGGTGGSGDSGGSGGSGGGNVIDDTVDAVEDVVGDVLGDPLLP